MEKLEDAGLLSKDALLAKGRDAFGAMLGYSDEEADAELETKDEEA